jgi:hypothetical protein
MPILSKKAQTVFAKVSAELSSGTFSLADKMQLSVFCYENPSITYLGLLEKAEKYLPTNIDVGCKIDALLKVYLAYKNLVERQLSPIAVKLYESVCIDIRLKKIVYEPCWYLPFFTKFVRDIDTSKYLEFQNWEEVLLIPAILGSARIDISKVDTKVIKDFYLKHKLKVKAISKIYDNLATATITTREMKWEMLSPEELAQEKWEIATTNLFGKEIYLKKLNEFQISRI